ncbi:MAG: hypothetical protein KA227_12080 [Thermoanaerobaculia bacterium]|nr:hypothetical protein [Thermoanaerobaculia bacterium]
MATLGEQSLLSVLHGGEPLPGVETELAAPLRAHPSANIPLAGASEAVQRGDHHRWLAARAAESAANEEALW